jgi:hypothetical protein
METNKPTSVTSFTNDPILFSGWRRQSDVDRGPDQLSTQRRVDPHAAAQARPESQVLPVLPGSPLSGDFHHSPDQAKNTLLHVSSDYKNGIESLSTFFYRIESC